MVWGAPGRDNFRPRPSGCARLLALTTRTVWTFITLNPLATATSSLLGRRKCQLQDQLISLPVPGSVLFQVVEVIFRASIICKIPTTITAISEFCPDPSQDWTPHVALVGCEGQTLHLTCPQHTKIQVHWAFYSRWKAQSYCSFLPGFQESQCQHADATPKVYDE